MPVGLQLSVQIIVGLAFLATILIGIWLYCKHKSCVNGLWSLTSKVPDLLKCDLSPLTKLFDHSDSWPEDIAICNLSPILVPNTNQATPAPWPVQPSKTHPLAVSLPSTTTLHTDDFEVTSFDHEPHTWHGQSTDQRKKSTLDYVQQAAFQLYQQDHIPWKCYTKHLKCKQKMKSSPPTNKPTDWVMDLSDVTTHL